MANNQLKEEIILSTQYFDKKIDDVMKRVNKLQNQGSKIGDGFNTSMGKMIGMAGKLSGALGAITSGVQLADWFKSTVSEGVKLAEQGEGIRLAFERLNRGDLLDKLRQETHNTVTDLELMKQAVKFNDFKLNIDEMGTLLAFAQQKAKDTGQSIDYMVDSIVTGLGRKSLPILDNLGLSAAEIKEKMKESGDMTKAVAEIIKEKMNEAGDYVETAADRAKKQETELQNELEKLGRTFQPLTESSNSFFHSIEIGAIKATTRLGELLNNFTELGRVQNRYLALGGSDKVQRMIGNLGDGKTQGQKNIYTNQIKELDKHIKKQQDLIKNNPYNQAAKEELQALNKIKSEYKRLADNIFNPKSSNESQTPTAPTKTKGGNNKKSNDVEYAVNSVGYLQNKIRELEQKIKLQVDPTAIKELQKEIGKTKGQFAELMQPTQKLDMSKLNLKPNVATATNISAELTTFLKRKPIEIVIDTRTALEKTKDNFNEFADNASSITDAFFSFDNVISDIESLSNAIGEGANAWQIFMGVLQTGIGIIQTISSVMEAMTTIQKLMGAQATATAAETTAAATAEVANSANITAAKTVEAGVSAVAGAAQMPFPFSLIAIAAAVAAVLAALASVGAFANGGIVGGNSYGGDRLFARVNSGEMILNGHQQKNLFNLLDRGATGGANGGNVNFVIRGKDLHGVLNNFNDKMNKIK